MLGLLSLHLSVPIEHMRNILPVSWVLLPAAGPSSLQSHFDPVTAEAGRVTAALTGPAGSRSTQYRPPALSAVLYLLSHGYHTMYNPML